MGLKNRSDLKEYFLTGQYPDEDQFADLIDSMVNFQDDGIDVTTTTNITADTNQDQTNAYQLLARCSIIKTCANDGDAVKLPQGYPGNYYVVFNDSGTGKYTYCFPFENGLILNVGIVDNPTTINDGACAIFFCCDINKFYKL